MGVISFISFSIGSLVFTNIIDRAGRKYVVLVASLITPLGIALLLLVR
jgi:MFS family permease